MELVPLTPTSGRNANVVSRPSDINGKLQKIQLKSDQGDKLGIPLQDIDPSSPETFIVLGTFGRIWRFPSAKSFGLLEPWNPVRKLCLRVLTHAIFSLVMSSVVILHLCQVLNYVHILMPLPVFLYVGEMLLKMLAMGMVFGGRHAYFRNRETWIDVVVIILLLYRLCSAPHSYITLEVIMVLKLIHYVDACHYAWNRMMRILPTLGSPILLFLLTLVIFSTTGLHSFMGILTQRCVADLDVGNLTKKKVIAHFGGWEPTDNVTSNDMLWNRHVKNVSNHYLPPGSPTDVPYICSNTSHGAKCPSNYTCLYGHGENPNFGYTSYDNILSSLIQTIQMLDQDYFEFNYFSLFRGTGSWLVNLYFVAIFFFGSFPLAVFFYALIGHGISENQDTDKEGEGQPSTREWVTLGGNMKAARIMESNGFHAVVIAAIGLDVCSRLVFTETIVENLSNPWYTLVISGMVVVTFLAELVVKLVAQGGKNYFTHGWSWLDMAVILQYVLAFMWIHPILLVPSSIFKLIPKSHTLTLIGSVYADCLRSTGAFHLATVLLVLFASWGTIVFRDYMNTLLFPASYNGYTRWNFLDLPHAIVNILRAWMGEWNESMWDLQHIHSLLGIVYFYLVVLVGSFVGMLLVVTIALMTINILRRSKDREAPEASVMEKIWASIMSPLRQRGSGLIRLNESETEPRHPTSKLLQDIQSKVDWVVAVIILCSSIIVGLNDVHINPTTDTTAVEIFFWNDMAFIVIMIASVVLECWSNGPLRSLKNPGWLFDIAIVTITSFRFVGLNGLRLLMVIRRIPSLNMVREFIFNQICVLWKYLLAFSLVWSYFAIFGEGLFGQKLYSCSHFEEEHWVQHKLACLANNESWINSPRTFDTARDSFVSLVTIAVRNGWIHVVYGITDITYRNAQPILESSFENIIFIFGFFIAGVLFPFSILMGVLYAEIDQKKGLIREDLQEVSDPPERPEPPTAPWRRTVYGIVTSQWFATVVITLIVTDVIVYMTEHFEQDSFVIHAWIHDVIGLLYTIEAVLKIIACGKGYFCSGWNWFDFVIVVMSWLHLIISDIILKYVYALSPGILRIFRLLRLLHYQPLIGRCGRLTTFFNGLRSVLPTLMQILLMEVVAMFSYCLVGIGLFKNVKLAAGLDEVFNFHTFGSSFQLMFAIATTSGTDGIRDALANEEDCEVDRDCGHWASGTTFVYSFIFINFWLMSNFYLVAVNGVIKALQSDKSRQIENQTADQSNDIVL